MTGATPRWVTFTVLAVGVLMASTGAILVRMAQQEGIASLAISTWRMGLATLLLLPFAAALSGRELRGLRPRDGGIAVLAGLFLAGHFVAWISSLEYTSVASSVALVTTNPIWVGLATVLIFRERLPRLTVVGIAISLAGCALILWADLGPGATPGAADGQQTAGAAGRQPALGNALALLGAVGISAYLLTGRRLAARLGLLSYITLVYGAAAIVLAGIGLVAGVELWRFPVAGWWALAGLAIGPQLIGHTAFNWALRRLSPTFVALSILGEPIGSAVLAGFLFGEIPSVRQLLAFATLLAGISVAALGERGGRPQATRSVA